MGATQDEKYGTLSVPLTANKPDGQHHVFRVRGYQTLCVTKRCYTTIIFDNNRSGVNINFSNDSDWNSGSSFL